MENAYSRPILIGDQGRAAVLDRVPLRGSGDANSFNEDWLRNLLYRHPEALPVAEINEAFSGLIPVCRELNTPAGPIDALFVTSQGRIAVLEAKLWRNPEQRRKVIGQILDYAKELSRWSYETLDAAVRAARRRESLVVQSLFEVAAALHADMEEARFIDAVQRSLHKGDLLLLIAGDGIRENVGAITTFIEDHGTLHFTFGLLEMAIYQMPDGAHLVQPRILAQSTIVRRIVVDCRGDVAAETEAEEEAEAVDMLGPRPDLEEQRQQFSAFWSEFLQKYPLDDQSQPVKGPAKSTNQFFYLPDEASGWICAVAAKRSGNAGVYVNFRRGPIPDRIYAALLADQATIDEALALPVKWISNEKGQSVQLWKEFGDGVLTERRALVQAWLGEVTNRFVNTFRPRVLSLLKEQQVV